VLQRRERRSVAGGLRHVRRVQQVQSSMPGGRFVAKAVVQARSSPRTEAATLPHADQPASARAPSVGQVGHRDHPTHRVWHTHGARRPDRGAPAPRQGHGPPDHWADSRHPSAPGQRQAPARAAGVLTSWNAGEKLLRIEMPVAQSETRASAVERFRSHLPPHPRADKGARSWPSPSSTSSPSA
jgi:hypothetical protein